MSSIFSKNGNNGSVESMVANRINNGTVIKGDLAAQSDIRVEGKIIGNVDCTSKVVVGSSGVIEGYIKCTDLTIEGKVKGNIEVSGILFFKSNAVYEGEVKYKKLVVEEGASIVGSLINTSSSSVGSSAVSKNEQAKATI